jgi:hypothetical protein
MATNDVGDAVSSAAASSALASAVAMHSLAI